MSNEKFLYCTPTVFVIGNEYEILINLNTFGLCFVKVRDAIYYEENSGVLPSERTALKVRVPQSALDSAKEYEIIFRQTEDRKSYWSTFLPPISAKFEFKPLEKTENINIYYISDVHNCFDVAKKTANYFGDDVDMFVINGDCSEYKTEESYLDVSSFVGDVAGGKIPVLFTRGNHDTRGRLSALFTEYFPSQGKNTYYTFELGCLNGLVLDCGEDKRDVSKEYDSSENTPEEYLGINRFHEYRKKELEFIKSYQPNKDKITFAVSHVCPAKTSRNVGDQFDIDREVYTEWCRELDRIDPAFMLCGHIHDPFVLSPDDERNLIPHKYPVVVGVNRIPPKQCEYFWGAAVIVNKHSAEVRFTDNEHTVHEKYLLEY